LSLDIIYKQRKGCFVKSRKQYVYPLFEVVNVTNEFHKVNTLMNMYVF